MSQLDRLEDLDRKAAPGPWAWRGNTDQPESMCIRSLATGIDVFGTVRHEITVEELRRRGTIDYLAELNMQLVSPEPDDTYDARCEQAWEAAEAAAIDEALHDKYGEPETEEHLAFVTDGLYADATEICVYEVCPEATSRDDKRVYRADIIGLRHPDAQLIVEMRATLPALLRVARAAEQLCHTRSTGSWTKARQDVLDGLAALERQRDREARS